ncbi:MAG: hypothetical protein ACRDLQ_05040 [Solirubrobacterales bacterium]
MKLVHVLVVVGAVSLLAAPAADAKQPRKLSESKVRTFLKPIAADLGAGLAEDLKTEDPTVTVVAANVGDCERRNRRRIDCDLNITFRDAEGDLTCSLRVGVKYRNKRSKKLVFALLSGKPKCYVQ